MIKVNGKEMDFKGGNTVRDLLDMCKFTFPHIVVKINGKVIMREQYAEAAINDGDDVQVIHLIGGG
jgi:sulfur carrier protein